MDFLAAGPACVYGCVFAEPQNGHAGREVMARGGSRVTQASEIDETTGRAEERSRILGLLQTSAHEEDWRFAAWTTVFVERT